MEKAVVLQVPDGSIALIHSGEVAESRKVEKGSTYQDSQKRPAL